MKKTLAIIAILLLPYTVFTQINTKVKPNISLQIKEIPKGYKIEAIYDIPDKMHQYLSEKYFTLDITGLSEKWQLEKVMYPEPTEKVLDFPSYSGRVSISREIKYSGEKPEIGPGVEIAAKFQICYDTGVCLIPSKTAFKLIDYIKTEPQESNIDWLLILGFSFLGGLILNLMPCVLPVISIKLLSILKLSGEDKSLRRAHGFFGLFGTISSMLILAILIILLKAAGSSAGWGFYFQTPWYTLVLGAVLLVFALNLFGIWELPAPRINQKKRTGLWSSFFSGVLAVVLATPCTAPFLGSAVGAALSSTWYVILASFFMIGLGLGLPLFILTYFPVLSKFIPKSGAWMDRVRILMGFALVATFIWLLSILAAQIGLEQSFNIIFGFLGLSLSFWVIGLWKSLVKPLGKIIAIVAIVSGLGFFAYMSVSAINKPIDQTLAENKTKWPAPWQDFSNEAVDVAKQAAKPIFIDFTAAWCTTCHVNENGPLSDAKVLKHFADTQAVLLRGDYTNPNPLIDQWLTQYKRAGVPFYLFINAQGEVRVLPEILDVDMLLSL